MTSGGGCRSTVDFTYEIAMPKLHTHFKKLKQDIAELGVAELTARVDTLERNIKELSEWSANIDTLKTKHEELAKRLATLEKKK